LYIPKFDMFL